MVSYLFYSLGKSYYKDYFSDDFYEMIKSDKLKYPCPCEISGTRYNLYNALNKVNSSSLAIAAAIGCSGMDQAMKNLPAKKYVGPGKLDLSFGSRNSIDTLVDKTLFNDPVFDDSVDAASIVGYSAKATKKLFIFTL